MIDWKEINLGPRATIVAEVIAFVEDGPLLAPPALGEHPGIPVTDLAEATRLAWHEVYGAAELSWADIREWQAQPMPAAAYRLKWFHQPDGGFSRLLEAFFEHAGRRVPPPYVSLVEDISSDLYWVAQARALLSEAHPFVERIFEIYKAGGWPCGWGGASEALVIPPSRASDGPDEWRKTCPEGRLLAFYPVS